MFSTIGLVNTSFTSHNLLFVVVVVLLRTLKLYFHSNFQVSSTVLYAVFTMLYPRTYLFYNGKFILFDQDLPISPTPQALKPLFHCLFP